MPKENVVTGVHNAPHRSLFHALGLTEEEQRLVNELVYKQRLYKLDLKKAVRIKQESSNKPIEESEMHKLLSDNPKSFSVEGITFSSAEIGEYKAKFKDETHMKNSIIEFLKNY